MAFRIALLALRSSLPYDESLLCRRLSRSKRQSPLLQRLIRLRRARVDFLGARRPALTSHLMVILKMEEDWLSS